MKNEIDFSVHVAEVLNRNNIQLQSIRLLDQPIKELFFKQGRKAILVMHNRVYERQISSADDTTIDVLDSDLIPYLKLGQLILLVLPSGKKHRYVLQTTVAELYAGRIRLHTLDPRKNRRFELATSLSVRLRNIPDATALRMRVGEVRAVRHMEGLIGDEPPAGATKAVPAKGIKLQATPPADRRGARPPAAKTESEAEPPPVRQGFIRDILYNAEQEAEAVDYQRLKKQSPVAANIADVSLGGICLRLATDQELFFADRLVLLQTDLEQPASKDLPPARLRLHILSVIRNARKSKGLQRLNLEFLARLPDDVERYFPA